MSLVQNWFYLSLALWDSDLYSFIHIDLVHGNNFKKLVPLVDNLFKEVHYAYVK